MDLKRGIDNAKNIENKTILLTSQQIKYNQSLRKNHEEMQKIQEDRQLQKNRRSKKISKTRRRKIAIDLNEKTKTKNNKNIFELSTLINLSKIKD